MKPIKMHSPDYRFTPAEAKWVVKLMKMLKIKNHEFDILNTVLIERIDNQMYLTMTNMETTVIIKYDEFIVPQKDMMDELSRMYCEAVLVPFDAIEHYSKSENAEWFFTKNLVKIDGIVFDTYNPKEREDYPEIFHPEEVLEHYEIYQSDVQLHIQACVIDKDKDSNVKGINLKDGKLNSTDKRRALITNRGKYSPIETEVTVPVDFLRLYSEISDVNFFTKYEDFFVAFQNNRIKVISRSITEEYPDIKKAFRDTFLSKMVVKVSELNKVKQLEPVYKHCPSNDIRFDFEENQTKISSSSFTPDRSGEVIIPSFYLGSYDAISINAAFLKNIFEIAEGKIFMEMEKPLDPIMLSDDSQNWKYIIMPLKEASEEEDKSGIQEKLEKAANVRSDLDVKVTIS